MPSTIRFLCEYLSPRPAEIDVRELTYRRGACSDETLPATLYRRAGSSRSAPAWVLLHGLTYHGRKHPSLDRFARALAASGTTVIVPEIPEWSALRVAPHATGPSIAGAIDALLHERLAHEDRIGVFGFSFGATQGIVALADPALGERVRNIVAWGGYCDLYRLFRFGVTGEHELDGVSASLDPDPYGAWIMGANYLTGIPGHERDKELAAALGELALESGRAGVYAGDAFYDPVKARLRERLPPAQQETFRIFAPLPDDPPADPERVAELIRELAASALRADPILDPQPHIPNLRVRTQIAHGREDRLIPYTESLRLSRLLPAAAAGGCTITSLFAHSTGSTGAMKALTRAREVARFCQMLHRILQLA